MKNHRDYLDEALKRNERDVKPEGDTLEFYRAIYGYRQPVRGVPRSGWTSAGFGREMPVEGREYSVPGHGFIGACQAWASARRIIDFIE